MKRPAAAPAVLKRPAARTTNADAPFKKPASVLKKPSASRRIPKSSTWKLIHTSIYRRARTAIFQKTGDDDKAKDMARLACQKAKKQFLEGTLKHPKLAA